MPMTLSSFIVLRPPAEPGVAMTLMWTTVSTSSFAEHLGDDRAADVGADEVDVADVTARRDDIDADDAVDARVAGGCAREAATDVPGHPGDQHDPAHDSAELRSYLPSLRRCTRVFLSSLRCFFLAMRLRRFLTTEPTK